MLDRENCHTHLKFCVRILIVFWLTWTRRNQDQKNSVQDNLFFIPWKYFHSNICLGSLCAPFLSRFVVFWSNELREVENFTSSVKTTAPDKREWTNWWTDEGPLYFKESIYSLQLLLIQETPTKKWRFCSAAFQCNWWVFLGICSDCQSKKIIIINFFIRFF